MVSSSSSHASSEREQQLFRARLAAIANRYDDMFDNIKKVVKMDAGIIADNTRDLLAVAFENVVGSRLNSWRILSKILTESESGMVNSDSDSKWVKDYMLMVEEEIRKICCDTLFIVSDSISPKMSMESTVLLYKMRGDSWRHLAEINTDEDRETYANYSFEAYKEATILADKALYFTDPIRLGLALSFSLLCYEILNTAESITEARIIATKAINGVNEQVLCNQGARSVEILKKNLTLWNKDGGKGAK